MRLTIQTRVPTKTMPAPQTGAHTVFPLDELGRLIRTNAELKRAQGPRRDRRTRSQGQALVMVTLALLVLAGMMGLAVDLGWSYFVEKQAQAAADAAALGAVQEAMTRMGGSTAGFDCAGGSTVTCQSTPVDCSGLADTNNLWNGCLYAQQNGFTHAGLNGRQRVTIQSDGRGGTQPQPPTAPGVSDIVYWVTVRTTQTVPQLFSAVLGNTEGVVSASGTAGIVATVVPAGFYGLNREGDCINSGGAGFTALCGVDIDVQGASQLPCLGHSARICAPTGMVLGSTCSGLSEPGCGGGGGGGGGKGKGGGGGGSGNLAGQAQGNADVVASYIQVRSADADGDGDVETGSTSPGHFIPSPQASTDPLLFRDPTEGLPQPPLAVSGALGTCGIPNGIISGTSNTEPLVLGPYQYYATNPQTGNPTGQQIVLRGNVTFSATSQVCAAAPGVSGILAQGASPLSTQFGVYLFYGGLDMGNDTHFTAGQYVSVGVTSETGAALQIPQGGGQKDITGDTNIGTQFITTAPGYPGLDQQMNALPAMLQPGSNLANSLRQGNISWKSGGGNTRVQLDGLDKSQLPTAVSFLGDYRGNLIWQDRRNSSVIYDSLGQVVRRPCYPNGCSSITDSEMVSNRVTANSPKLDFDAGIQLDLEGNIYQPRGAWFDCQGGGDIAAALQIITGMVQGQGNCALDLQPTPFTLIRYIVALVH